MRRTASLRVLAGAALAAMGLLAISGASAHPGQHGPTDGHLIGTGASGDIRHVQTVKLNSTRGLSSTDLIADVGVSPDGNWAFLANWGEENCDANSEAGGVNRPDAGIYVVDISKVDAGANAQPAKTVGFIASSQDSRPGEGVQVENISTKYFNGRMLVFNNEHCGKNGKGGVSLYDVRNPLKPVKLADNWGDRGFADANHIHSAYAWDAGAKAYVVLVDNVEISDVDILDITNPRRPRLIAEYDLNALAKRQLGTRIDQQALGLQESSLHDMTVKKIGSKWIMLVSYWDGGFVSLDVTTPTAAKMIGDTDYNNPDPELLESTGIALPPEGNGHQAEFTANNQRFIATDEDFSPYRPQFTITTGPNAGPYAAGEFGWTKQIVTLPDKNLNGPTVYGGYGCPENAAQVPSADSVFPAGSLAPGEERIIVFQRGPVQDPSHNMEACFFSDKVAMGESKGYEGVIVANHHVGAQAGETPDAYICGSQGSAVAGTAAAICIGHRAMHLLFNDAPSYELPYAGSEPAVGTKGEKVNAPAEFDGWGYVHLYATNDDADPVKPGVQPRELDTYAIDEAHNPAFASGYGTMSVHEVATHVSASDQAYLAYYEGGLRSLEIVGDELVETGRYLDPKGNDFWGVETFVGADGKTYILGSDRDSGLWIFEDTSP